ncbi:hypothetical protein [Shewanella litorisediminis]|uniref:DUF1795 domain-containing protein n=1 Tax=Shewanella litorisediminis TaxID=1173586 RepID=A0ABX7G240_9GAMM|nr:hypothetical protein [Shewanella litorisediminis]MCL2918508.1 hypothetical protein [Shewanella litorisediminis]QRH01338.1 hypothetical protein JQC75_16020 [Shewanella litorisediminis]
MTRLVILLLSMVGVFFVYRECFAPLPLESHFLASVPVKVRMLPQPNTASKVTGEISVEQVVSASSPRADMTLLVLAMGTAYEVFDEQDIHALSREDLGSLSRRFGTDTGLNAALVRRGFIEHQGKKGYELVVSLGQDRGEMVQRIYTHDNHLLMLMASYATDARERKTAMAFLDSLEFL